MHSFLKWDAKIQNNIKKCGYKFEKVLDFVVSKIEIITTPIKNHKQFPSRPALQIVPLQTSYA